MSDSKKKEKDDKPFFSERIKEHFPSDGIDDISRVFVEQQSNIINEVNDTIHSENDSKK